MFGLYRTYFDYKKIDENDENQVLFQKYFFQNWFHIYYIYLPGDLALFSNKIRKIIDDFLWQYNFLFSKSSVRFGSAEPNF